VKGAPTVVGASFTDARSARRSSRPPRLLDWRIARSSERTTELKPAGAEARRYIFMATVFLNLFERSHAIRLRFSGDFARGSLVEKCLDQRDRHLGHLAALVRRTDLRDVFAVPAGKSRAAAGGGSAGVGDLRPRRARITPPDS